MTDKPPPPPPLVLPPPQPMGRGLGWFFAISGAVLLFLTLGCVVAVSDLGRDSEGLAIAALFGLPTFVLGGLFLWLGRRRLKR
jgi:hypothetical protein